MKRLLTICFAVVFMVGACDDSPPPLPLAKKEELRKILDPKFTLTVPQDKEEDFYRVLEAFAKTRMPDEFVYRINFVSSTEAGVRFSNSGIHGGGVAKLNKKSGTWIIDLKLYYM